MRYRSSVTLLVALALSASPAWAQVLPNADPGSSVRSRADLERLLDEYQRALASTAYSEAVKRSIRADAELIRGRLTDGTSVWVTESSSPFKASPTYRTRCRSSRGP